MSLKQKIKGILATAGAIAMVAGTAFAATPQTVYEQAVQNAAQKPQGQYTMQFSAQVPVFGTASATSVIQVQQEPFIAKATTKMEAFGNKPSADILAYVEQDGKNLNFYYAEMKGKKLDWHKKTQQLKSDAPLAKDIKPLEHPSRLLVTTPLTSSILPGACIPTTMSISGRNRGLQMNRSGQPKKSSMLPRMPVM